MRLPGTLVSPLVSEKIKQKLEVDNLDYAKTINVVVSLLLFNADTELLYMEIIPPKKKSVHLQS